MMTKRIRTPSRKRATANVIGGRSSSPILIKIQVVPQIKQRISQTRTLSARGLLILVKAERRFPLLQNTPATQISDGVRHRLLRVVFDHQNASLVQQGS